MPRPIHFDLTADDPERAAAFYASAFGWKFSKWDGPMDYWLISTGEQNQPGIDGGLGRRPEDGREVPFTLDVSSVDDYAARVTEAGGTILQSKQPVPGVGWMVVATDTEGNPFAMMELDERAGTG